MAESPVDEASDCRSNLKVSKICGVCGDKAKSYHFGGISCDSCKAFFRRSVQNEAHKHFHCPYESRCHISLSSRKCCQFCRFRKCVAIGMEKSWVMSEQERLQLLRQRMKRKANSTEVETVHDNNVSLCSRRLSSFAQSEKLEELSKFLSPTEITFVDDIVNIYQECYRELPFPSAEKLNETFYSNVEIVRFFTLTIRRVIRFAQRLQSFCRLKPHDQNILLRQGMVELCAIRGVHAYDCRRECFPDTSKNLYKDSSSVRAEDISRLVSPETFEMHMKFTTSLQELQPDEPTLMLFLVTVLFSPDRQGLQCRHDVEVEQERLLILLRKYMDWRYGVDVSAVIYPKLLLKLPDLRELNDAHTQHNLRLDSDEIAQIQTQLTKLKLVDSSEKYFLPSVLEATLSTTCRTNINSSTWCSYPSPNQSESSSEDTFKSSTTPPNSD